MKTVGTLALGLLGVFLVGFGFGLGLACIYLFSVIDSDFWLGCTLFLLNSYIIIMFLYDNQ